METFKKLKWAAVISLICSALGCSDVAFTPAENNTSLGCEVEPCPITKVDTFNFNEDRPLAKVDVMFVIDNSGSMADEQAKLAPRLSSFVDSLSNINWQIGITTTDVSNGPRGLKGTLVNFEGTNSRILTKATANYEDVFLRTVTANGTPPDCEANGTCGSGDEQPLEATRLAITKRDGENAGFFREGADLAVIVLSDEDEMSSGPAGATTPQNVIDLVTGVWSGNKTFSAYGIIVKPGDSACIGEQTATGGKPGTFVQALAEMTGGMTGSICDTDYSSSLVNIGRRVRRLATTLSLTAEPVIGTVQVTLSPADPEITWEHAGRIVRLSDRPRRGTRVAVTYTKAN